MNRCKTCGIELATPADEEHHLVATLQDAIATGVWPAKSHVIKTNLADSEDVLIRQVSAGKPTP